jgi:rRNA-processing protein FCF1
MPTRRRRKSSKRRTKKSGRGVGGLKQHLKHLNNNKALVNKLKSAAKGKSSPRVLKKVSNELKRLARHARKAASAASKGVTKLKRAMSGTRKRRRRRR